MNGYTLIWVTDLGYAGMDHGKVYETVAAAQLDADNDVKWTKRGREYVSTRSQYGDIFHVKPVGR